jgi:hypothetical protein
MPYGPLNHPCTMDSWASAKGRINAGSSTRTPVRVHHLLMLPPPPPPPRTVGAVPVFELAISQAIFHSKDLSEKNHLACCSSAVSYVLS